MKLCVVRRESGPARVARCTLRIGLVTLRLDISMVVVLTEEQKSLAVPLAFKDRDHLTLGMHNFAKWSRTILMAGIANKQWEGVVTLAPTARPTEISPTPRPLPCAFSAVFGSVQSGVRLHHQPELPRRILSEWSLCHQRRAGHQVGCTGVPHGTGLRPAVGERSELQF